MRPLPSGRPLGPTERRPGPARRGGPATPHGAHPVASSQSAAGEEERLQRTLARAGFGSRRAAEDLIRAGRVQVNGTVAGLGRRVRPSADRVTVDGVPVPADPELRYFALNKPAGVTATLRDPHAETSLAGLLPQGPRVFPVGRLDRDSEGLLLLTNDGELAHRLQHPRYGVEKEYLVEVQGLPPRATLRKLMTGVELEDGPAKAVHVGPVEASRGRTALPVVMAEGRKREVRRMFDAIGFPVRRLVRTRLGPVRLSALAPGKLRRLGPGEVASLYRSVGLERAAVRERRDARTGRARS